MVPRIAWRVVATTALAALTVLIVPGAASAHEVREHGDLVMVVGFGTEPAYQGQPNSVQLILEHDGEPVTDLGDTLDVEVSFGDAEPLQLAFEPYFEVGEFGTPGDYRAWLIPTEAGPYTFHITGTVDGEDVDETFTSGPDTFGEVDSGAEIQYPVPQPAASDLVERIERESARVADANAQIEAANAAAAAAAEEADSAKTIALVGAAIGLLGVAAAGLAVIVARRGKRSTA